MKEKEPTKEQKKFPELDYLEYFTTPFHINDDSEKDLLDIVGSKEYDHVVVIGRFQPLHYGHIYLIKQAARMAKQVTIGIGSANIQNDDNPFTAEQREYMLKKALVKEGLASQIREIVYLDDMARDFDWINNALTKSEFPQAVVGNNEWVNSCFRSVGRAVEEVPLLQRGMYEGTKIRAFLRKAGKI